MGKKKFDFGEYWGQQLFKVRSNGKDYLWALCRKKYGTNDIERKGVGINIGVEEENVFEMETDRNPESDTFGKRVPRKRIVVTASGEQREEPLPVEKRLKFIHEVNANNVRNYKKLIDYSSIFGNTQFYFVFRGHKYTVETAEEFWEKSIVSAKREYNKFPKETPKESTKFL